MTPEQFLKQTLTDIKVKLGEEFDKNFERKAFFDEKWKTPKLLNTRGSLMMRSGKLRKSLLNPKITQNSIVWSSSMPYADIHNNGGEIKVTPQMRKYFWAMYYKSSRAGKRGNLPVEAQQWKALALKPIGSTIRIEKRQFIGPHPQVDKHIKDIVNNNFQELNQELKKIGKK
ncbi:MAG: hypothetical protein Q4A00_05655 [Flavobacteriaceae bacterium]|nr:hypothetical protein [Flavobacteriaceae bacterium]